jgi:outer membrane protein assembly factor BamB
MRLQRAVFAGLIVILALGCSAKEAKVQTPSNKKEEKVLSGEWRGFRNDSGYSGMAKTSLTEKLVLKWSYNCKESITGASAISRGVVYAATTEGKLLALSLKDGKKIWEVKPADSFEASPLVIGERIFLGDMSGIMRSFDRNGGKEIWKFETGDKISAGANFSDNKLIFSSYDGSIYCLNAADGTEIWKFDTGSPIFGGPAVFEKRVFAAGCDGMLRMINIDDQSDIKEFQLGTYVVGSPACLNGFAYTATRDGTCFCVDINKESSVWEFSSSEGNDMFYASPASDGENAVFVAQDSPLRCLDAKTGKVKWEFQEGGDSSPIISGNLVFWGSALGKFYCLDIKDGKKLFTFDTGNEIKASPAIIDDALVISSTEGIVYCFQAESRK